MPTFEGVNFLDRPTRVDAGTHNGARNKPNEDRFAVFTGPGDNGQLVQFLVVADGVTSTHGGERASDIAVRVLQQILQTPPPGRAAPKLLRDRVADAIHRANHEILEAARKDPELKGMSTTLVVAAVDGNQLLAMHLGDSRAYLVRGGKAHQLTRDHTWVQEALEEGRITREQAANHPNKHVILRYLGDTRGISIDQGVLDPDKPLADIDETEVGRQQVNVGDTALTLRPGDALLLCSDGLYNRITDAEIAGAVTSYAPEKAVKSLIDEAVKRQEPDNITIVLWTTMGMVAPATASRRPALALAAAGAILAILAFLVFSFTSNSQPVATPPANAGEVAAMAATVTEPSSSEDKATAVSDAPTVVDASSPTPEQALTEATPETPTMPPLVDAQPSEPAASGAVALTSTSTPLVEGAPGETITETQPVAEQSSRTNPTTIGPEATLTAVALTETQIAITVAATDQLAATATQALAVTSTRPPTSTPAATPTASPSPTPTLTRTPLPAAVAPTSNQAAAPPPPDSVNQAGPRSAVILAPGDNHSSHTATLFRWKPDADLAPGQEYEVVFWKANGESEADARGLVRSSPLTEVLLQVGNLAPDAYRWALYLVQPEPYRRIRPLAGPFAFTVPSGGGGSGSGGGPAPEKGSGTK
ncbi:MAG: protein phosphatase 2C domain-containing protein [Caldilineaceae bacterium]|nr:protein phosphatase 2C domain-containing protein [Caldilineaceae bacterium]